MHRGKLGGIGIGGENKFVEPTESIAKALNNLSAEINKSNANVVSSMQKIVDENSKAMKDIIDYLKNGTTASSFGDIEEINMLDLFGDMVDKLDATLAKEKATAYIIVPGKKCGSISPHEVLPKLEGVQKIMLCGSIREIVKQD